ncbi:hypothetical protein VTH82DRAFT_369 [Thermothelomyces myriococcoides]
MAGFFTQPGYL